MRYLVLLYRDETTAPRPGTAGFAALMPGYQAFAELAGDAIVAGEALQPRATSRTIRHDGDDLRVTAGPFAESVEALGGFYVLEAPTLDDAIELARRIPAASSGAIEIRPMVQWYDRAGEAPPVTAGSLRYFATMHGPELEADVPGTAAWEEGAAAHGRFVESATDAVLAGGAVQPTDTATTIRLRDGELLVTDGPFSEAMEVIGGFYVLQGAPDAVVDVASRVPVNDGGAVELRPILELGG